MASPRPVWKGQISFGLVNLPVTLYSGERRNDIKFHLLDSRTSQRVRYQRVNEETGEEVPWDQIVKGYEYDDRGYVLLSDEEMEEVNAKLTKRIEIEDFVQQAEIDPIHFDKPYYLEPGKGGEKPYALLRETLRLTEKVGIARVVIRSREHLAALMVRDDRLVLEILRFPQELRDPDFLELPDSDSVKMNQREIDLALKLVESMTTEWDPDRYHDEYRESLMQYIEDKVERGEMSAGDAPEEPSDSEEEEESVVNLMDYLKKSVEEAGGKTNTKASKKKAARKKSSSKASKKQTSTRKKKATSGGRKSA